MDEAILKKIIGNEINNIEAIAMQGSHTDNIYRINSDYGQFIYKQYKKDRNNEYYVYQLLLPNIADVVPLVHKFENGVLMKDLGRSLRQQKIETPHIISVLELLKSIHFRQYPTETVKQLPKFIEDHIELKWIGDQINTLELPELETIYSSLQNIYATLQPFKLRKCVTHGDCHLDNIFITNRTYLIDWERAAIASPVRDITMFLLDLDDIRIDEYKYMFLDMIKEFGIAKEDYQCDFKHFMVINAVKMMVWEIGKYQLGYQLIQETITNVEKIFEKLLINL